MQHHAVRRASADNVPGEKTWVVTGANRRPSKSDPLADMPAMDYTDLTFVNESPQDERSTKRRRVQSHIARRQHRYRREARSTSTSSSSTSTTIATPTTLELSPELHIEDGVARLQLDSPKIDKGHVPPVVVLDLAPPISLPLDDPGDALSVYVKNLDISMPQIFDCLRRMIGIQSPDFEIKYAMPRGIVYEKYYPFVLSNPVLLSAVTLVIVSRLRFLHAQPHATLPLLRLRGFVIDGIQNALADPVRSTSDHIIVAVAIMSVYEALFGHKELHRVHMEGLRRMIELRGGLNRLDLDGLLDPLLLWYDAHTAAVTKSPLALKGLRSAAMYRQVDKELFLLGVKPAHETVPETVHHQLTA